jgi:hypothetical protein
MSLAVDATDADGKHVLSGLWWSHQHQRAAIMPPQDAPASVIHAFVVHAAFYS